MSLSPYNFFEAIGSKKQNLIEGDSAAAKDWKGQNFVVMRQLSQHIDSILIVEQLNQLPNITPESLYMLLLARIRQQRRKWVKGGVDKDSEDFKIVSRHFGYSHDKTEQAMKFLSQDFIKSLYDLYDEGGSSRKRVPTRKKKAK